MVISRKGKTSYLQVAWHTPSIRDRDIYSLSVMDTLLATGKSSRLYRAIVEKGLATKISSSLWEHRDPGMYAITATLAPGKSHHDLEEALLKEVEAFKDAPIEERELIKARNLVKAFFFKTRESLSLQAEYLSWFDAIHTYKYLETYLARIEQENQDTVRRAAKNYLTGKNMSAGWFCAQAEGMKDRPAQGADAQRMRFFRQSRNHPAMISTAENPEGCGKGLAIETGKSPGRGTLSFTRHVLPNGLTAVIKENHSVPTVSVAGYVKAGSGFDPRGKAGLSYFTASMLDGGTAKRSSQDIAGELEFLGASLSYIGERETTSIEGWSMAESLESFLPLLADTMMNPAFPAEEQKRVTQDILTQLNRQADDPQRVVLIAQREMIYPEGHPYRSNTKGYTESIQKITAAECADFHRTYYRPDMTVLVFVGDVQTERLVADLNDAFGQWKAPEGVPPPALAVPPVDFPAHEQKKVITMKEKAQVAVVMGNRGLPRGSRDWYAFDLLNSILGGNTLTSRLGEELRDKEGLVYFAWSYQAPSIGEGPWLLLYGTNEKNVKKSIQTTTAVIKRIQTQPVGEKELKDAKGAIINKLIVELQTNSSVAERLKEIEYFSLGRDYMEKIPSLYQSVTSGDLLRVAQKHIHPAATTMVIAGPYKEP